MLSNNSERLIIGASLAVKIVFFVLLFTLVGHEAVLDNSDSNLVFAQNWYQHGVFSADTEPPYTPSAINTPGYPLFLIVTGLMTGWVGWTIILQILLVTAAAVMLYRMLRNVFPEKVALWGAIFFAIEPWNAFVTNFPLTEATFLFAFIAGCYAFETALRQSRVMLFTLTGLLLGVGTMIRPIAQFLPILFVCFLIIFGRRFGLTLRTTLVAIGVLVCGYVLVVGPYVARNYAEFGVVSVSTKGPFTVHFYDVNMLLQYREGISATEANERLFLAAKESYPELRTHIDLMHPKYAKYLNERSLSEIAESPFLYIKLHASSLATFFFSDGYRLILQYVNAIDQNIPNITFLVLQGNFADLWDYLRHNALVAISFIGGVALWSATTILAFAAIPIAFFREQNPRVRAYVYAFGILLLYFAVLTGLVAMARYRVPITPFLFPLAIYSSLAILSTITRKKNPAVNT